MHTFAYEKFLRMKKYTSILFLLSATCIYGQTDTIPARELGEIVVSGEKPEFKSDAGVITVDLPEIVKDKPVTNILEALGYLPGVMNLDGMIALSGAQSTAVVINGEVSQMSVQQLYQLLYSMPVDRLKCVEIMYSAPAKYHVSGAVINVVLKTPSALDGLQGQVRAGYSQGHYASWGGGASAIYAIRKWTFDLNYMLSRSKSWQSEDMTSWHSLKNEMHVIDDKNRTRGHSLSNQIYGSIGYNITDNSAIKATYTGQITGDRQSINHADGTFGRYLNVSDFPHPTTLHDINLNYKSAFGLTLSADWLTYREQRGQNMLDEGNDVVRVVSANRQHVNRYRFTADMEHDISGWTIGYGMEYRLSDDHSSMEYHVPDNPGFKNDLTEHTANAYVSLSHSFPWGLSFQASIGEELYRMDNENHWIFQPQIGLTYYKTPTHIFQANFNTDRSYPSYWTLHGGVGYLSPYSEIWGNPSLKPSTTHSANAAYILKQKYVAAIFFSNTDGYSVQLPYQSAEELKLIFQEQNANYSRMFGFNVDAPVSISDRLDTRLSAQGYYRRIRADHFHDMSYDRSRFTIFGTMQNTFRITRRLSVSLDISGISKSLQGIADLSAMWRVDAGAKWNFGRANCCELNLKAEDIFNTWSPVMRIDYGRQNYRMKVNDMSRRAQLTFIYRFNGFKPKDNSIDTSRLGTGK